MEKLEIKETNITPYVLLDQKKGTFKINGRSVPEDSVSFYEPVHKWFEEYKNNPHKTTHVHINLEYFNTSSSKALLDIFRVLNELYDSGNDAKIVWYYEDGDEDMQEAGEDYADLVNLPFEYVVLD